MTPRTDDLDGPVAELVSELATWRTTPAPPAGPALRDLFAQTAVLTPPAAVTPRRSTVSEPKRLLTVLPAKIAAGVVGALLAGSLGAGAMTGTITLTSNESDPAAEVEGAEVEGDGAEQLPVDDADADADADAAADALEVVEVEEEEAEVDEEGPKDPGDPTTAPVPTSVSEAAKNHQFDEACGNHGAYVSHFARTGEEPECATAARNGTAEPAPESTEVQAAEADAEAEAPAGPGQGKANASPTGVERSEAGKAKAAANKAKAPGRAKSGR